MSWLGPFLVLMERYAADLPRLAELSPIQRAAGRVRAAATASGYCRRFEATRQPLARGAPKMLQLDLHPKPGIRLRGRVLTHEGHPVPRAEVRLLTEEGRPAFSVVEAHRGGFLHCVPAPGRYRLVAAAADQGFGFVGPFEVPAGEAAQALDVVLRGIGTIEGTVRTPEGLPVPDLTLRAIPPRGWPPTRPTSSLLRNVRADEPDYPGEGLTDGETRTNAEGSFRFSGLRPGKYFILAMDVDSPRAPPRRLCDTGGRLSIVLAPHRLRIRVRDEQGQPIPGAAVAFKGPRFNDVLPVTATGALDLFVRPAETYRLHAMVPGCPPAAASITVPERPYDTPLDLVLREAPPLGKLRLQLRGPDGVPMPTFQVTVLLESRATLFTVANPPLDAEGFYVEEFPPDRYLVEVLPGDPRRDFWFPLSEELEVVAGAETKRVWSAARAGGRVRVHVPPPPDLAKGAVLYLHLEALRAGESGTPSQEILNPFDQVIAYEKWVRTNPPGWIEEDPEDPAATTLLLEPGPYDFAVWAEGYRRFERSLNVVEGHSRLVEVQLVRK